MLGDAFFVDAAKALAPLIRSRPMILSEAADFPCPWFKQWPRRACFGWIPRSLGGEYGAFAGYLPPESAREIYGSDPHVVTAGAFRPVGRAMIVDGGYRSPN